MPVTPSDAEDVGVLKSASQFPCMVHEGHYCTRGKVTRRRKCIARETSLHRTSGAAHDAHETSMKAATNSLDNYLAYQWFALRGSKRDSKGSTFYSSCA